MNDPIDQLLAHVRYRLGPIVSDAQRWRIDELSRLMLRYWPHRHLESASVLGGRRNKSVSHAMSLAKRQAREQWEARHGIGPMWPVVLDKAVDAISVVYLDLWFGDRLWALRLEELGRRLCQGVK
jgi:hypothetical protein